MADEFDNFGIQIDIETGSFQGLTDAKAAFQKASELDHMIKRMNVNAMKMKEHVKSLDTVVDVSNKAIDAFEARLNKVADNKKFTKFMNAINRPVKLKVDEKQIKKTVDANVKSSIQAGLKNVTSDLVTSMNTQMQPALAKLDTMSANMSSSITSISTAASNITNAANRLSSAAERMNSGGSGGGGSVDLGALKSQIDNVVSSAQTRAQNIGRDKTAAAPVAPTGTTGPTTQPRRIYKTATRTDRDDTEYHKQLAFKRTPRHTRYHQRLYQ